MALVKLLKWDSNFFGFNIADVIPKTINDISKRGFGKLLIRKVLFFLKNNNSKSVSVVTQRRNYKAQRFYHSARFNIDKIEMYYHLWWKKLIVNEK